MLPLLLLACAAPDCADGFVPGDDGLCYGAAAPCADGFVREADGNCYAEAEDADDDTGDGDDTGGDTGPTDPDTGAPDLDDLLDPHRDCAPMEASDRLDLDAGCVDGACVGMTKAEVDAALGAATCAAGDGAALCYWGQLGGVRAWLDDLDGDGVADADATVAEWLVYTPYDGSTADGLGIEASLGCWLQALGDPDLVVWRQDHTDGGWYLYELEWFGPDVSVVDFTDRGWVNMDAPDGLPDILTFSGP